MLSCLIIAGSLYLSGPLEAVRLDDVRHMTLEGRTLHVEGTDMRENFTVTALDADLRPAQIIHRCVKEAEAEVERAWLREEAEVSKLRQDLHHQVETPIDDLFIEGMHDDHHDQFDAYKSGEDRPRCEHTGPSSKHLSEKCTDLTTQTKGTRPSQ